MFSKSKKRPATRETKTDSSSNAKSRAREEDIRPEEEGEGREAEDEEFNDGSIFCQQLKMSGVILKNADHSNEISVRPTEFYKNLRKSFKRHLNYPQVMDQFLTGLQEYIQDRQRFIKSLQPCVASKDSDIKTTQTCCLLKLLLEVECLQPKLLNILLEKLPEFTDEEECVSEGNESPVNIPRLLLLQLQRLENIVDMTALREKLMEVTLVTSVCVQREIISCLPEIMDVTEHTSVISVLKDLLEQEKSLTISILDTLSNLVLSEEQLAEVLTTALEILPSCELDDLPVVVKFILQSVPSKDALSVFTELRNHLQFDTLLVPLAMSTPIAGPSTSTGRVDPKQDGSSNAELLVVGSIHSCLQFLRQLAVPCIKMIEQTHGSDQHQVLDLVLLFLLHSLHHGRAVESLFRNKIRSGDFTAKLLERAFLHHSAVLQQYFSSVQAMCRTLFTSSESAISHFARVMYQLAFRVFDPYARQVIIDNLIAHIGSGMSSVVDMVLDILLTLADTSLTALAPFALYIQGLLEYLDKLHLSQIRKLYSILSQLSSQDGKNLNIRLDLLIFVRKQLMSCKLQYIQHGVIGGVMLIKDLVPASAAAEEEKNMKDAMTILELMYSNCLGLPQARALFMDELSMVVTNTKLSPKVLEWLEERVTADFQDNFVVDITEEYLKQKSLLPYSFQYSLDDDVEDNIAVKILPLLNSQEASFDIFDCSESKLSPLCLVPTLRLLGAHHIQKGENLEDIMALLGCSLCVTESQIISKIETLSLNEKETVCSMLFYTLNWFREIINIFSTQSDVEVSGKVILRLKNITDTQEMLVKCLTVTPGYVPPVACFDTDEDPELLPTTSKSSSSSNTTTNGTKKAKKSTKRKKPSKNSEESSDVTMEISSQLKSQSDTSKDSSTTNGATVSLSNYQEYFRELTLDVLDILLVGQIVSKDLDSQMNTETLREVKIELPQVEFLLKDLCLKLQHSLPASHAGNPFFNKESANKNVGFTLLNQKPPEDVAAKVVHLMPAMCKQLEEASAYFQTILASNDGIIDTLCHQTDHYWTVVSCFQLLLDVLHSLFAWKDITSTKNQQLFTSALSVLATRISPVEGSFLTQQQAIKQAVEYLHNFCETCPNVESAVKLVEILIILVKKGVPEYRQKPAELAELFLHRVWLTPKGDREKGAPFRKHIQKLLKCYLSNSASPLDAIEKVCGEAIPQLINADDDTSAMYPSLTASTFSMFYRVLFEQLVSTVKNLGSAKKNDSLEEKEEKIHQWNLAVRIFQILTTLIKKFDGLPNLGTVLKSGRLFVDAFTVQAMPLLDVMYCSQHENIHALLKSMQLSTRPLHYICYHSKIVKSVFLTNQIPQVKKSLEQLMIRVKVMLSLNNCEEGYMVGVLKNRNLLGDEILSQSVEGSKTNEGGGSTEGGQEQASSSDEAEEEQSEEEKVSDVEVEEPQENGKADDEEEEEYGFSEVY
ncbi:Fanconi anemia group D2 protein-like [Argonauta hians]